MYDLPIYVRTGTLHRPQSAIVLFSYRSLHMIKRLCCVVSFVSRGWRAGWQERALNVEGICNSAYSDFYIIFKCAHRTYINLIVVDV